MPPQLALVLTLLLIGYLIRRDRQIEPRPSAAVWIPTIWLFFSGSRQPQQWLSSGGGSRILSQALQEGSRMDQVVYLSLILAGIFVLMRRRDQVHLLAGANRLIVFFLIYEGLSIVWSDFPFVAFKRWIKASGDFVMVFVLISDPNPLRAVVAVLKRTGFLLIPLSVLFCKYYQHLGRSIDSWGRSYYTGVTLDKNMFGYLLFAYGLFFVCAFVCALRQDSLSRAVRRTDLATYAMMLMMIAWVIPLADSKTSLLTLIIGTGVLVSLQLSKIRQHFWPFMITTGIVGAVANALFSMSSLVLEASGRNATLTGRTGIWDVVLSEPINPILGTGYASFWLGERLERIWEIFPRTPLIQAHNGYIEVYLNLGLVGLMLLGGMLWVAARNAGYRLLRGGEKTENLDSAVFQTFGVSFIVAYLLYNITEATFMGLNFLFFIFLLVAFNFRFNQDRVNVSGWEQEEGRLAAASWEPVR